MTEPILDIRGLSVGYGKTQVLWDISLGWYEATPPVWNIILTPNYNSAHDNHFHVDMTPLSHFRGAFAGAYFGENPHPGE